MYLIIKGWKGRLGNNILQLIHSLTYANYYKLNLIIKKHKYFKKEKIILFSDNIENKFLYDENNDFTNRNVKITGFKNSDILFENIVNKKFIRKQLLNIFKIKIKKDQYYNDKTLIIYIRSGDIFNERIHPKYISAPYYYYDYILQKYKEKYNNYILVAENLDNPVIKKILKKHPYIIWNKNNLKDDLKIVLGSSHIVSCIGTFISSLSWIATNMKKVYLPSFVTKKNYYSKLEFEKIELSEFKEKIGKWKNTKEQHELLLNYKPNL